MIILILNDRNIKGFLIFKIFLLSRKIIVQPGVISCPDYERLRWLTASNVRIYERPTVCNFRGPVSLVFRPPNLMAYVITRLSITSLPSLYELATRSPPLSSLSHSSAMLGAARHNVLLPLPLGAWQNLLVFMACLSVRHHRSPPSTHFSCPDTFALCDPYAPSRLPSPTWSTSIGALSLTYHARQRHKVSSSVVPSMRGAVTRSLSPSCYVVRLPFLPFSYCTHSISESSCPIPLPFHSFSSIYNTSQYALLTLHPLTRHSMGYFFPHLLLHWLRSSSDIVCLDSRHMYRFLSYRLFYVVILIIGVFISVYLRAY